MIKPIYQQFIDGEYSALFELADETRRCVDRFLAQFNEQQAKLFDLPPCRRIFLFILTRSIKTYSSIVVLCQLGYGQDVATLLRGLLENLITVKYILSSPRRADHLAERFVAYKWVIFKRSLPEQEKLIKTASEGEKAAFYKRKEMIMHHVEEFKKKFRVTSDRGLLTWSGKTVRDMAKQADPRLLEEYDLTFRQCSKFSHPSILGDKEYLVQDSKSLIFSPLPSQIGVVINLKQAVKYFLEIAALINDQFHLGCQSVIEQLNARFNALLIELKNHDISLPSQPSKETVPIRECTVVSRSRNKTYSVDGIQKRS